MLTSLPLQAAHIFPFLTLDIVTKMCRWRLVLLTII